MNQGPLHSGAIASVLNKKYKNGNINAWGLSNVDPGKEIPARSSDDENLHPINIYTEEVIVKPKVDGSKIHYELFSEVYLTDKKYFLGSNIQRGELGAVSRTYKQPLSFDPNIERSLCPDGYHEEGFNWLIYWRPKKLGTYRISMPENEVPFYVLENEIKISEVKNETVEIPFFFKKNVQEDVVVLRVGTPLFTLEYLG